MSERITYRQLKPFCLPTSLDGLSGPHTGSLRLPIHLCWSPGDHVFDLARLGDALTVYQYVIAEGTTQEQTRIPQSRPAHRTVATPPPRCQDHRCLGEHIRLTARKKQMGAHPHRTHALGGIAFLPHRSARHQPPYAGDSDTHEPLSATLGSRGLSDRTRWWGQFQVLWHGWTAVSMGVSNEFVPTDHVVGQSGGALDTPARRLTGSSHVRV